MEEISKNGGNVKRFGAIEVSSDPQPIFNVWKRIVPDGKSIEVEELRMSTWNPLRGNLTIADLLIILHDVSICDRRQAIWLPYLRTSLGSLSSTEQSNSLSVKTEDLHAVALTRNILKLTRCELFVWERSYLDASHCYRKIHLEPLSLSSISTNLESGMILTLRLMWHAINYHLLFALDEDSVLQYHNAVNEVFAHLEQRKIGEERTILSLSRVALEYYRPLFDAHYRLQYTMFHYRSSDDSAPVLASIDTAIFSKVDDYITNLLYNLPLANDYWMKLQMAMRMVIGYLERGHDPFDLFASMANYALQSGAVSHAARLLHSGLELSQQFQNKGHLEGNLIQVPSFEEFSRRHELPHHHNNTYLPSAVRLQYLLTIHPARLTRILPATDALQQLLSVLTQVTMPVILTADALDQTWEREVYLLRKVAIDTLRHLTDQCREFVDLCNLNIHHRGTGVRGLFLAAYQGLNLLTFSYNWPMDNQYLRDATLPAAYYDLLDSIAPGNEMLSAVAEHTWSIASMDSVSSSLTPVTVVRPIRVLFVCYSISRHSVGRLLAKLLRHLILLRQPDTQPVFEVTILTDKPHPTTASTSSTGKIPDEIFAEIASLIPVNSGRWITLPAFEFSDILFRDVLLNLLRVDPHSEIQHHKEQQAAARLFDVAVFSDLLMQASLCTWLLSSQIRLAQTQILFWGHPQTTGMGNLMDYYITAESFEPPHLRRGRQDSQFAEQLVQFDSLSFLLYEAEDIATTLPGWQPDPTASSDSVHPSSDNWSRSAFVRWLYASGTTMRPIVPPMEGDRASLTSMRIYGAVQSLMKHHPLLDVLMYELLSRDKQAIIVLLRSSNTQQAHWHLQYQARLYRYLLARVQMSDSSSPRVGNASDVSDAESIVDDMMQRLIWIGALPHAQYARVVCHLDVQLDFPVFGGGVTLCDGLVGRCPDTAGGMVGFVTAGALQTVHHIGAGLARKINDSSIAVDVTARSEASSMNHQEILALYAQEAIRLATRKRQRRDRQAFATGTVQKHRDERQKSVEDLIYEDSGVFDEWVAFLKRVSVR